MRDGNYLFRENNVYIHIYLEVTIYGGIYSRQECTKKKLGHKRQIKSKANKSKDEFQIWRQKSVLGGKQMYLWKIHMYAKIH